jgi:hypothetical protein
MIPRPASEDRRVVATKPLRLENLGKKETTTMNYRSQKPRQLRPRAPSRPGGRVMDSGVVDVATRSSKSGLWLTLGFHVILISAACFITFKQPQGKSAQTSKSTAGDEDFQMPVVAMQKRTPVKNPVTPAKRSSAPVAPPQNLATTLTIPPSLIEWPQLEPIFSARPDKMTESKLLRKKGTGTKKRRKPIPLN